MRGTESIIVDKFGRCVEGKGRDHLVAGRHSGRGFYTKAMPRNLEFHINNGAGRRTPIGYNSNLARVSVSHYLCTDRHQAWTRCSASDISAAFECSISKKIHLISIPPLRSQDPGYPLNFKPQSQGHPNRLGETWEFEMRKEKLIRNVGAPPYARPGLQGTADHRMSRKGSIDGQTFHILQCHAPLSGHNDLEVS